MDAMSTPPVEAGTPRPSSRDPLEEFKAPAAAGTLGTWLFSAGLTIAFVWLLVGYVVTRRAGEAPPLEVPVWFWFSTFAILVSSVTLHWAYLSAKLGRSAVAASALRLSTALGLVFLVLQTPGLIALVQPEAHGGPNNEASYLFALTLVCIHGLHAIGGLGRMIVLNKRQHTQHADENGAAHLKQMCLFWHLLAVIWVVMFGVILWA